MGGKMRILKYFKILSLLINLISLFLLMSVSSASVNIDSQRRVVTKITRITHPAYTMQNVWQGEGYGGPWSYHSNEANRKIIIVEAQWPGITNPKYGNTVGRGIVWGNLNELKALGGGEVYASTLSQYQSVTNVFPKTASGEDIYTYPVWSILAGEENMVYTLCMSSADCGIYYHWLVKLDVTNWARTPIVDIANPSQKYTDWSLLKRYSGIVGWTSNNTLIIAYGGPAWDFRPAGTQITDGVEIGFNPTTETYLADRQIYSCNEEGYRWPFAKEMHRARRPDGKYIAHYGTKSGVYTNDYTDHCWNGDYTNIEYWDTTPGANMLTHVHWQYNNDWFVAGHMGKSQSQAWQPYMADYSINQVFFDSDYAKANCNPRGTNTSCPGAFTHNTLVSMKATGFHSPSSMINPATGLPYPGVSPYRNYHGMPTPTLRADSKQLMFMSTNGTWSLEDRHCAATGTGGCDLTYTDNIRADMLVNYNGRGMFLVDLAYASGSQTCTSFTYSSWTECQPNNTQTRTVISSSPSGCTIGNPVPVLTQSCTYNSATPALTIFKIPGSPIIDGNLTEYASVNPISFSPASGGNTVTVKTLWNSEALYFGIDVTDSQLNASVTTRDGSVWNEDSIEWFIDTYYDGGGSSNPNSPFMRPDDYQGIVNILNTKYDSQGTTNGTPSSSWNGTWQSAVRLNGTQNNNSDTDSGYTLEIKIPWTSIGYSSAPSADTFLGMSFAVNDKDSSGTYSKMWLSNAGSNQNASNWQRVSLSNTLTLVDTIPPGPPIELTAH